MAIKQLSLETLQDLNEGAVKDDFNEALARAIADCLKRPGIDKARTVDLKIKLTPDCDDSGTCDSVNLEVHIGGKGPGYVTMTPKLQPRRSRTGGMLVFDTEQMNLFDDGSQE